MNSIYFVIAPFLGVIITLMNTINSRFALAAGNMVSIVVVHLVGLAVIQLCNMFIGKKKKKQILPLYYYSGGIIGFGTIYFCNIAYSSMPTSLAVALALFGQTVFSLFIDASGFMKRQKYPLNWSVVPGLILAAIGILVLAGKHIDSIQYVPAALLAGCLPTLAFVVNGQLSEKNGTLYSTRMNYMTGLATSLLVAGIGIVLKSGPHDPAFSLLSLITVNPIYLFGGALLGVIMVGAANLVFPRIPALYASLLIFTGQSFSGLLVDFIRDGELALHVLFGTFIVLLGLGINLGLRSLYK